MTRRRMLLILAFVATLLAVYFAPPVDDAVVQAAARPAVADAPRSVLTERARVASATATGVIAMKPRDDVDGEDSNLSLR